MPKRKHAEYLEDTSEDSDATSVRAHRKACSKSLEKGKKELVQGLKLAAAFERQKQGRRKKTAAAKGEAGVVDRLEREYAILKTLELSKVADQHLRKTISRVKSVIAHAATLPQWVLEGEKETHSNEVLNVLARLYKAPAVKKVVDQIIQDLKKILGVAVPNEVEKEPVQGKERPGLALAKSKASKDEDKGVNTGDFSGDESDDFAGFESRIAGPSSREESDESDPDDLSTEAPGQRIYSGSESDSESDAPSHSSFPSSKSKPNLASEILTSKPAKSTFLPSLTMGGYMSGSESEASDLDEHMAPKKNRRGQRARQQIWEKKFGEKAKHLEKQKGDERSKGWDPKRGATLENDDRNRKEKRRGDIRGAKKEGRGGRGKGVESANGANAVPVVKKKTKRDDAGSLHPSWLAAKAAKEKKMNVVPTGKKIVFD
jgi:hypothetical protein